MLFANSVAIAAVLLTSSTMTEAKVAVGQIDNVGALYKNVRKVMKNPSLQGGNGEGRDLEILGGGTLLSTRCFTECIVDKLTPEECQAYIEKTIDEAGGHEVGDITIKIQTPRSAEVLATTYWMVEVPANVQGQFTCDRNDGKTFYPFEWSTTGGEDVSVPDIDCQGLSGGECCLKIRQFGSTIGGRDVNGYCLGCFVYQEPLIPQLGGSGLTEYEDYIYDTVTESCELQQFTDTEVAAFDGETQAKMDSASQSLSDFISTPSCDGFESLLKELYDAATVIKPLSEKIGQLACEYCYDGDSSDISTIASYSIVSDILNLLSQPVPSSAENCVIIYTNEGGDIVDIPKLGGSRADDEYDDDCDDNPLPPDEECPEGSTKSSDGSCVCDAGTATQADGTCVPCDPRTISAAGDATCEPCSEGYLEVDNIKCDICPPGTCQAGDLNECVPCEPGLFQPLEGQNFCLQCPRGSSQPLEGQVSCVTCPENWVQPKRGQTTCEECPAGTIEGPRDRCIEEA